MLQETYKALEAILDIGTRELKCKQIVAGVAAGHAELVKMSILAVDFPSSS
jgi:hypothetical protein